MKMSLNGRHAVKIGDSIRKKTKSNLVTFKYDFLPGSLATNKPGEVILDSGNSITVKVPNQTGTSFDHTFYKGTYDKACKECVLIVDKKSGEMILEKIDYVVNLKNSRERPTNSVNNPLVNSSNKKRSLVESTLSDSSDDDSVPQSKKTLTKNFECKQNMKQTIPNRAHERTFDFGDQQDTVDQEQSMAHQAIDDLQLTEDEIDGVSERDMSDNAAEQVMHDILLTDSGSGSSAGSSSSESSTSGDES